MKKRDTTDPSTAEWPSAAEVAATTLSPADYFNKVGVAVAESLRMLQTGVLLADTEETPQAIVITSAVPDEGKTTVAIGLACAMATSRRRTVLVEADMHKPSMRGYLPIPADAPTVMDLLMDPAAPCEPATAYGVDLLPAIPSSGSPALIASSHAEAMLQRLRQEYDSIIIDTPPATMFSEAIVLGNLADGVVTVMNAAETDKHAHRSLAKLLRQSRITSLGVAVNRAPFAVGRANQYYYYGPDSAR